MKLKFNKNILTIKTVGEPGPMDEALFIPLFLKKIIFIQFLEPNWSLKTYAIFYFYIAFHFIYVFIGTIVGMKENLTPLVVGEGLYTLCPLLTIPPKIYLFAKYRSTFRDLYLIAKTDMFSRIQNESKEKARLFLRNLKYVGIAFSLIALANISVFLLLTIYYYLIVRRSYVYPVHTLVPMTTPLAYLAFFFHNTYNIFMSINVMILDMWFVVFTYSFCAASDSLAKVLSVKKDVSDELIEYQDKLQEALRLFYNGHRLYNDYLNKLSEIYGVLAISPLLNATMSMCIILFACTNDINSKMVIQFFPVLMEVFAYNWCGEWIKTMMNKLRLSLIYFDWVNLQYKDKKSYQIMTTFFCKRFGIKLLNGTELSLILMTSILKISYQAFTVLRQMK